jgi:hypothetical protein
MCTETFYVYVSCVYVKLSMHIMCDQMLLCALELLCHEMLLCEDLFRANGQWFSEFGPKCHTAAGFQNVSYRFSAKAF